MIGTIIRVRMCRPKCLINHPFPLLCPIIPYPCCLLLSPFSLHCPYCTLLTHPYCSPIASHCPILPPSSIVTHCPQMPPFPLIIQTVPQLALVAPLPPLPSHGFPLSLNAPIFSDYPNCFPIAPLPWLPIVPH